MLEIADLCIFIRKDKIDPVSFVTLFQLSFDTILHCLFQSHIFWSPLLCYIFNLIFCLWSRRYGLNIECCLTNLVLEYCLCCSSHVDSGCNNVLPDSQIDGANVGPTWGRQDPGGPHVDHSNVAIWAVCYKQIFVFCQGDIGILIFNIRQEYCYSTRVDNMSIIFHVPWQWFCEVRPLSQYKNVLPVYVSPL